MHALHKCLLFHVLTSLGQNALGSKIINGELAPENSLQFMASVQMGSRHLCGGFLVSEDFVVTAAHCANNELNPTRVVLDAHNLKNANKTMRLIDKKCKHPSYRRAGLGDDIMLLRLSRKVELGKRIQLVQLPYPGMNISDNQNCRVAGWGMIKTKSYSVDDLRMVDVSIIKRQVCESKWPGLPPNVLCAGGYETNKGFCQGDSGGPLVCNGRAVGVVSFNRAGICDYPDKPNVYTDISKYLPWINKVLQKKDC